jgi:dipeptidase E
MPDVEKAEIRIAFGGGGEEEDERTVLDRFADWLRGGLVLYIPLASDPPYDDSVAWVTTVMASRGAVAIAVGTSAEGVLQAISTADGVFIGGGNTYRLLNALRMAGADVALAEAAHRGRATASSVRATGGWGEKSGVTEA